MNDHKEVKAAKLTQGHRGALLKTVTDLVDWFERLKFLQKQRETMCMNISRADYPCICRKCEGLREADNGN